MSHHFVLSDFENVQFTDVGSLKPGTCRIKIFIGQSQTKMSVELFEALRPFGSDVDVVRISGSGPNALDFHIAFYVGCLAAQFPGSRFSIISRDTGFDPLIKHLAGLNISCQRISKIPGAAKPAVASNVGKAEIVVAPKPATSATNVKKTPAKNVVVTVAPANQSKPVVTAAEANTETRATEVLKRLKGMTTSRPTRVTTLQSSIKSFFKPALNDKQLASVIQSLADSKKIAIDGTKVSYTL
ncbi:MAG: hypothetical protein H0T88_07380 [Lysobacter sp.]|nr:hypothetical protein [Lysobacter sp.]